MIYVHGALEYIAHNRVLAKKFYNNQGGKPINLFLDAVDVNLKKAAQLLNIYWIDNINVGGYFFSLFYM